MDGIDTALVDFSSTLPQLIGSYDQQWPTALRQALLNARKVPDDELDTLSDLDQQTARIFAHACSALLTKSGIKPQDVTAIGSHGQTIRHRPDIASPFSLQIGNAKILAELTGIDVISDFRTADIKAGGQGAPLAPAFHQAVFSSKKLNRVIVNIGGISNITRLAKDENLPAIGFDCGPGNTLMDAWIAKCKKQSYDKDGAFAASGKTSARLLAHLLMDDFFQLAPPKSTGFEYFNVEWLHRKIKEAAIEDITDADIQSTLCDLTATSIIRAINQFAEGTDEIYICGGGAYNQALIKRLQAVTKCSVQTTGALGVDPDRVEAMAFAWLAYRNIHGLAGNLPAATGANDAVVLGSLTSAQS